MDATPRHPAFPLPVARTDVDPDLVLDLVDRYRHNPNLAPLTLTLGEGPDPTITVAEHEREIVIPLAKLTARLARLTDDPTPGNLERAFIEWLDTRPVSDQTAARKGIATIGWSHQHARITWRVVVPRPTGLTMDWVPTLHTAPDLARTIRADALARAQRLTVTPLPTGEVTVWAYLLNPALSTSVLSQPDLLGTGAALADLYAVFTPGRPVAVATQVPALRLTEESSEPHMMLPLANLDEIGWT